ncbi:MAG: DUF3108 domain-containing protein, partial [Armatimonadota bacterium]|nr:DUF3108 domain-containing protein [Armatimonadota bacterium]
MRKFSSTLIVISLISLLFISSIPIQAQTPNSQEIWMGVYLGDMKLGYMSMSSTKTQYNGRDAYRSDVIMRTKMMLLGARIRQDINMVVYTDLEQKPIFEVFEMSSGGQTSRIEAEFKPDVIECKHVSQGVVTPKSIPIPPGTNLTDDSSLYGVGGKKVQVGDKFSANYFNPLTFTIDPLTSEVTHREKLELRGKTYDVFVVKRNSPMEDMTLWVDENGEPIQIIMKVTMIRETKEEAMAGL